MESINIEDIVGLKFSYEDMHADHMSFESWQEGSFITCTTCFIAISEFHWIWKYARACDEEMPKPQLVLTLLKIIS